MRVIGAGGAAVGELEAAVKEELRELLDVLGGEMAVVGGEGRKGPVEVVEDAVSLGVSFGGGEGERRGVGEGERKIEGGDGREEE